MPDHPVHVTFLRTVPLIMAGVARSGVRAIIEIAASQANVALTPEIEVQSLKVAERIIVRRSLCTALFAAPIQVGIDARLFRAAPIRGLFLTRFLARASDRPASRATHVPSETMTEVVHDLDDGGHWAYVSLWRQGNVAAVSQRRNGDPQQFRLGATTRRRRGRASVRQNEANAARLVRPVVPDHTRRADQSLVERIARDVVGQIGVDAGVHRHAIERVLAVRRHTSMHLMDKAKLSAINAAVLDA